MTKLYNASGLLLAMFFVACAEMPIENPNQEREIATRAANPEGENYYWSGGRKIYLDTDYTKMIVGFDNEQEFTKVSSATISKGSSYSGKATALIDVSDDKIVQKLSAEKSVKNKIFALKYSGYDDAPFYMTGDIVMQPKEGVSPEEILAKYEIDAEAVNKTDIGVMIRLKDWDKLLSTANAIYEGGMVDWCHPDFVSQDEKATNDQYFGQQYYLKNTVSGGVDINVESAWGITKGSGIRVAVVDDGVEDHDDLAGRVLNGYTPKNPNGNNSNGGNGRPIPYKYIPGTTDIVGHGQACAGIIAASHNFGSSSYIAGVAPGVVIIPINKFYGGETVSDNAAAIEYAWNPNKGNADVISNSWSYRNGPPNNADVFEQQINNAVTQGRLRNGSLRGCVVVFSAGNNYSSTTVNYPGYLWNIIAVGAVNKFGAIWNYSNRGTGLDVVAPSGGDPGDVYTLDRMGTYGYNSGNYMTNFNGTSAAAPQVAGIAALILSKYPNFTQQQVANIITSTASNNNSWNNQTGYGRVNAYEALLGHLGISGESNPTQHIEYTYMANPASLPMGVTLNNWTITPNSYIVRSGTPNRVLSIKFTAAGNYTLTANFKLPDNTILSIPKTLTTQYAPPPAPTIIVMSDGTVADIFVTNHMNGLTYEWYVTGGGEVVDDFGEEVRIYATPGATGSRVVTIVCRARLGNDMSPWSNPLTATVTYPYLSPALAKNKNGQQAEEEEEEQTE